MKIAFFFENNPHEGRDLRRVTDGNPGMAATPYLFFLIAHLLSVRDNGLDVTLLLTRPMVMDDGVRIRLAADFRDAHRQCCKDGVDYLVVKHSNAYCHDISHMDSTLPTKVIIWCHNFVPFPQLAAYARSPLVARLITVGREQADSYRDHRAFRKTDWIYNAVETHTLLQRAAGLPPASQRRHVVTYIGAIIPGKGFQVLAKAWPEVLRRVPDAQLYVIGNGRLYGDHVELGPWRLAERHFEARIMKHLTSYGQLLPGVHLMGIMGEEKYKVMGMTKVGVPNPSGLTETFCNSAVEMQLMGAVIASKRCIGYMDTVKNGRLVDNPLQLADCIADCLLSSHDDYDATQEAIVNNFSHDVVAHQWERLFLEALPHGQHLHPLLPLVHPDFELKQWEERLRRLKERQPWLYAVVPSLARVTEGWKALQWAFWKRVMLR